ncbi:thioredoxin domain-containing protein [Arthrobacter sp. GMC3]|uniref:thioredoxin domain-containing protein n=1 Tax=Arthrobacter sp. GMC3 TaxID=2058894 RepID=UPI000CE3E05D|nr:thioredoxin domain-containing protein [Arthrobacter sp. GMC3]
MNRLAGEPSSYLRQHAENPVMWQPFDDEAFAEARQRDVPIFLSVGYAACHWCHVMAKESFEDPDIGRYLGEHFVSIKVDREERPDVDDAFMAATQALSGQGGWPMSVFLTPDGQAFYAGTYFPPRPVDGRPSFSQVLSAVHEAWTQRREDVLDTAASLASALAQPVWQVDVSAAEPTTPGASDWSAAAAAAVLALAKTEDPLNGGFGTAPKFPPTPTLEFLMRYAAMPAEAVRTDVPGEVAFRLAGRTLEAMVHSALFDQLGGGFARYSVTADWSEPHYEKMLYDNAGLLRVLVHWIRLAEGRSDLAGEETTGPVGLLGVADARAAVTSTVDWLLAEMRLPMGAFASSLDADTVIDGIHREGASYQWSLADFTTAAQATLAAEATRAAGQLVTPAELTPEQRQEALLLASAVAQAMGRDSGPSAQRAANSSDPALPLNPHGALGGQQRISWQRIKGALLEQRATRVMPARDEKVVASWNGMLMGTLAEAGAVLAEAAYLDAAVVLGEYLYSVHWDGQLFRISHDGKARGIQGLLEDYAACANGYLSLYAATGDPRWFDFAGTLVTALERDFIVDGAVLNQAPRQPGAAVDAHYALQGSRFADPFDNASASGVAMLADAFISWAAYTGSGRHRDLAHKLLATAPGLAQTAPRSAGGLLGASLALATGPTEVAIVGPAGESREALVRRAWASGSPGMVIAVWDGAGEPPVPLLQGRGGTVKPLAYVCQHMLCARPVSGAKELEELLP